MDQAPRDHPVADLRRLFSDIGRVQAQLENALDLRLRSELGLSLVLVESMAAIADVEICRVQELATGLGVSAGSASKLADRLCALGYCRRCPNLEDRRSSLLQLTHEGQRKLVVADRAVDQELERLLKPVLSATAITELAATLRQLRRAGVRSPD
jgi:MarR family transcriptional regulator, organic hydroperoxide resistance regulator